MQLNRGRGVHAPEASLAFWCQRGAHLGFGPCFLAIAPRAVHQLVGTFTINRINSMVYIGIGVNVAQYTGITHPRLSICLSKTSAGYNGVHVANGLLSGMIPVDYVKYIIRVRIVLNYPIYSSSMYIIHHLQQLTAFTNYGTCALATFILQLLYIYSYIPAVRNTLNAPLRICNFMAALKQQPISNIYI